MRRAAISALALVAAGFTSERATATELAGKETPDTCLYSHDVQTVAFTAPPSAAGTPAARAPDTGSTPATIAPVPCASATPAAQRSAGPASQSTRDIVFTRHPIANDAVGIDIHGVGSEKEWRLLQQSGVRWVRIEFAWGYVEKQKGVYDFSYYDGFISALKAHGGIRLLGIMGYGNGLYDGGGNPTSDEAQQAFANWAAAAAGHFAGQGVIWELWNEPINWGWDPEAYCNLALKTGQAIKARSPNEIYVGPADGILPDQFNVACYRKGLLSYWDAITGHPYRTSAPETLIADYHSYLESMAGYAPGRRVPFISGEWGYASIYPPGPPSFAGQVSRQVQADYLARMWLTNIYMGIPISIWYDWRDDGADPHSVYQNLGLLDNNANPKPAYYAAKTFTTTLAGYRYDRAIRHGNTSGSGDYALVFTKNNSSAVVAWTTRSPHNVTIQVPRGAYTATSDTGKALGKKDASRGAMTVSMTRAPVYWKN